MPIAQNLKIGACEVYYKGSYMGKTKGGVTVNFGREQVKLSTDQFGETPVDFAGNGEIVTVTVRLAEVTLNAWRAALPESTPAGDNQGRLTFGSNAGKRSSTNAGLLVVRPIGSDGEEDIVLYQAVATDEIEVDFNNEDQRVLEIPFVGLVDDTKTDGNWLGHIGDSTD